MSSPSSGFLNEMVKASSAHSPSSARRDGLNVPAVMRVLQGKAHGCAAFESGSVLAAFIIPEGIAFTPWMAVATGDALVARTTHPSVASEGSRSAWTAPRSNPWPAGLAGNSC